MINRICNLIKRRGTACHIKRWYNTNTFISHFQVYIFAFVLLQFVQRTKYDENEVRWNWSIKNSLNHFIWNITKYFLLTFFLCFADDHLFLLIPKEYTKISFHVRLSLEENLAGAWATWRGEEKRPWPPSRIRPPSSSPLPLSLSFVLMLSCSLILLQKDLKRNPVLLLVMRAQRSNQVVFRIWLVFRVSAMRSAPMGEEGERALSAPRVPFPLTQSFPSSYYRFFFPERIVRAGP